MTGAPRPPSRTRRLRKALVRRWGVRLVPPVAAWAIAAIHRCSRTVVLDPVRYDALFDAGAPRTLVAFWHGRMLMIPPMVPRGRRAAVLVSEHRDGELIARAVARLGIGTIRGSTTRGGRSALRELVRFVRDGGIVAVTPDGPRGPVRVAQPGAVWAAHLAGAQVVPVAYAASRCVRLSSWDRMVLPLPFGRIAYALEEPVAVPEEATRETAVALADELGRRLDRATERAERAVRTPDPRRAAGRRRALDAAYGALASVVLLALAPLAAVRWLARPAVRARLGERFACYGRELEARLATGPRPVWIHAVSVGEVRAILPLVRRLAAGGDGRAPWPVVLTTVTVTGNRTARADAPPGTVVLYLPVDVGPVVRRAVRVIRPRLFVATESEIWPGLLAALAGAGVPAAMVNGRVSERSARRFARVGFFVRGVLERIALYGVQRDVFADRLAGIGAPVERIRVLGNMKYDLVPAAMDERARRGLRAELGLGPDRPVLVAGSTHAGEEAALLDALALLDARALGCDLVLAPRHPERFDEVAALVAARGLGQHRRSRGVAPGPVRVVLLDTIGELARVYAVGDVAFVGGTLVPIGGHNLLEPAAVGRPVLHGPHTASCEDVAQGLAEVGASAVVVGAEPLAAAVAALLGDPGRARAMGEAGSAFCAAHRGATDRTVAALAELVA